jgi:hypothetical protein
MVHTQVLDKLTEMLYPDAADDNDHRVIFKIDGGPGRLNLEMSMPWCLPFCGSAKYNPCNAGDRPKLWPL